MSLMLQETSSFLPSYSDYLPPRSKNARTPTMQRTATALARHAQPRLHLLARAPEPNQPAVELVIVSTPWLKKAADFAVCTPEVHSELGNVNIYCYEPWQSVEDGFAWQDLLNFGNELANALLLHVRASQNHGARPVVLMAHSLAGFIVKHCVAVADANKDRFRLLRDALGGIVFMGCPHVTKEARRTELYTKSSDILRVSNLGRRVKDRLQYGQELLTTCRRFDDVCGETNILSLHEQRPSKIPVMFGTTTRYLVEKRMAKIDSGKPEFLTSIDSDHRNLPSLEDDQAPFKLDEIAFRELKKILSVGGSSLPNDSESASRGPVALEPLINAFVKPRLPTLPFFELNMSRQRTKDFHGRDDILEKLETQLLSGPNLAVLYGMGGLGKSEVALAFVHRHRNDFDAIFWLKADDLSKMRQDFGRFAAQLGLEDEGEATDPFTSREMMKSWLQNPVRSPNKGGREVATWLVVFDGADDLKVLDEFKSIYGKGSILVTTRDPNSVGVLSADMPRESNTSFTATKMQPFKQGEAVDLLAKLVRFNMEDDEEQQSAGQIARMLDGWPLAINQMASVINSQHLTLAEFCERYKDINARHRLQNGTNSRTAGQSMVSSMRMALLSPQAVALLRVLAVLDPDCIHENLFGDLSDADVVLTGFPATQSEFAKAKNELLQASLVQRNGQRQELWLHRILQDTVQGQCSPVDFDCAFRTAANLVQRAWVSPGEAVRDNLKLWEPCAAYLKHVLHLQYVYTHYTETKARRLTPAFAFPWLLSEVCVLQRNLGATAVLKSTLDLALSICDDPPGLPRKLTFDLRSDIYHSLGAWANETNHPKECLEYNTRYLDMRQEAIDRGEAPEERTASAFNQFGTAKMGINEYGEAAMAFQKSIDLYATLPADTPCPDSLPNVNLAAARWLMDDLKGAEVLLERGILHREEAFGFMDQGSFRTGRFYHTLGNVRWSQGRLEESEIWHSRALKQYQAVLGTMHHRTADVRHRVAQHCLRKYDYLNAGILIDQALTSWRLDASSFRQEIARTTWLKARQRKMEGLTDEAQALREEAAMLRRELVPDDCRTHEELEDLDFDRLVAFWSR